MGQDKQGLPPSDEPRFGFEGGGLIEGEPAWDRMAKTAAVCVALARKHFGETLDYSPESLNVVNRIIISGWGTEGTDPVDPQLTTVFGAYLGEIIVRRTRGRWVSGFSDEEPASILYLGPGDKVQASFSPFMMVREKFNAPLTVNLSVLPSLLEQKVAEAELASATEGDEE